jgi:hypothetical protein
MFQLTLISVHLKRIEYQLTFSSELSITYYPLTKCPVTDVNTFVNLELAEKQWLLLEIAARIAYNKIVCITQLFHTNSSDHQRWLATDGLKVHVKFTSLALSLFHRTEHY